MDAVQKVVAEFDGKASAAIIAIAERFDIAVSFIDREAFDIRLKEAHGSDILTDSEWEDVRPHVTVHGLDSYISGDAEADFVEDALQKADITRWMD